MLPALPAAIALASYGIEALTRRAAGGLRPRFVSVAAWVILVGGQAYGSLHTPTWEDSAYPSVAQFLLGQMPRSSNGVVLISSDRDGEGLLIAEVASREPQPRLGCCGPLKF
jgi:hypothetical protein